MKKLLVFSLAVVLVFAFTLPAAAFESQFGGYWRTRGVIRSDFDGDGTNARDISKVDTRTRLYYTALLNDNLKFVNKFEFDTAWGQNDGGGNLAGLNTYGDFGADGQVVEVKESYASFNLGPTAWNVGIHAFGLARGFIYADEAAGVTVAYKNEMFTVPFMWFRGWEGGDDDNDQDVDVLALNPVFTAAESWSINPFVVWLYSDDATAAVAAGTSSATGLEALGAVEDASVFWIGVNVDGQLGPAAVWGTGIYQGGTADTAAVDFDISAYLFALGANVPVGPAGIHGQFFYASGDDDLTNDEADAFFGIGGAGVGQAYYWAEILGLGLFDWDAPTGSPNADVSNMWAANLGATIKPMEKLSLTGDIWYAQLVEDDVNGEDQLGFEIDLVATYQLVEGMNLDLVGAYLFAGDAVSADGANDEDPYELGWRLSLSF
jgi:hypothetical protein